jgi:predicted nucleic acid-binding protein
LIVESPAILLPAALRDPDDLHVLAYAIGASADVIVTGDNDLLLMKTFGSIPIRTVLQALEKLGITPD